MYVLKIEEMDTVQLYGQRALNFLNSDGLVPQLVLTIVIILVISTIISMFEMIVTGIRNYNRLTVTLLPDTYTSEQIYLQDPRLSEYDYLYPSANEFNGIEYSFAFQLYIDPDTYTSIRTPGFYNVFYKGDQNNIWPNMSPGVFLNAQENTLRIYMNAIDNTKDSYVEIPNMPVGKWFHTVIVQKGQSLDVYINGNIAARHEFSSIPKFNFGPVNVFSSKTFNPSGNEDQYKGPDGKTFNVIGPMKGMISKLKYYAYAISFTQIDSLSTEGPSSKIITKAIYQTPPYFHDSWWVTRYNRGSSEVNFGL
jgi:hypothetical protein